MKKMKRLQIRVDMGTLGHPLGRPAGPGYPFLIYIYREIDTFMDI